MEGALLVEAVQCVKDFFVGLAPEVCGVLLEVAFECEGGCAAVAGVVTDEAEGGEAAEIAGQGDIAGVGPPKAEAFIRQFLPGEEGAGVVLAGWGDVAVADEI